MQRLLSAYGATEPCIVRFCLRLILMQSVVLLFGECLVKNDIHVPWQNAAVNPLATINPLSPQGQYLTYWLYGSPGSKD